MKSKILGRRYATALLDMASSAEEVDRFGAGLRAMAELMDRVPEVREVLTVPLYPKAFRQKTLEDLCARGEAPDVLAAFFRVLLEKGRFDQFEAIVEAYQELLDERQGRLHATVVSAEPLADEDRANVAAALARRLGREVVVTARVDPDLLGGIRAEVGSLVIDGSVRSQLLQIKDRLVKG